MMFRKFAQFVYVLLGVGMVLWFVAFIVLYLLSRGLWWVFTLPMRVVNSLVDGVRRG